VFSAGEGYEPLVNGVQVIFNPGQFTKSVTVNTITDVSVEGTEMFNAQLIPITAGVGVFDSEAMVFLSEEGIKTTCMTCD
jgi:hypothetical protein